MATEKVAKPAQPIHAAFGPPDSKPIRQSPKKHNVSTKKSLHQATGVELKSIQILLPLAAIEPPVTHPAIAEFVMSCFALAFF